MTTERTTDNITDDKLEIRGKAERENTRCHKFD